MTKKKRKKKTEDSVYKDLFKFVEGIFHKREK